MNPTRLVLTPTNASTAAAAPNALSREDEAARRAATQFEALFLSTLATLSHTEGDEEDGDMFRSNATDMFQQMFGEQMGQTMAEGGGIGLADLVVRQIRENRGEKPVAPKPLDALRVREGSHNFVASPVAAVSIPDAAQPLPRRERITTPAPEIETGASKKQTNDDLFQMPIEGRVSSQFGRRRDPFTRRRRVHEGVDIAAPKGTPIQAAAEGTVVFAGRQRGYGNTVVIEHDDGRRTRYAHAARLTVQTGERVEKGEVIGKVGSTGRSTGPHLHFEVVNEDGKKVNPLRAVARDEAIAEANVSPTLARAAEAANEIRAAAVPVRASIINPGGVVQPVDAKLVLPSATRSKLDAGPVRLDLPVRGRISSNYGGRRDPFTRRHRVHEGVDIAVPAGTPIRAAAEGTVVFAGRQRGYGNTVILEHADGRRTRYAHASRLNVQAGERVDRGETIGAVGSTGRSTGPHLHFEVIDRGRHVNPLRALAHDKELASR